MLKARGEKAWPPLMMFKALLLQSWYKLSDPALEKRLARDLLFRRFTGLDISQSVPDHSTFWRFRQKLETLSLMDELLNEINAQLSEQGLYIKSGEVSIVDTSVIEAKQCRPNKDKQGNSTQDREADWNVKTGSDVASAKAPTVTKPISTWTKMASSNQRLTRQVMSMTPTVLPIY